MIFNIFRREKKFMDWDTYKKRVEFINLFAWQQHVRKKNLNMI